MQEDEPLFVYWALNGLGLVLLLVGLLSADPEGKLAGVGIGSVILCLGVPYLASCYVNGKPWRMALLAASIIVGILYANAWACRLAGTRYIHPLDHVYLLLFCIPGTLMLGIRWRRKAK